MGDRNKSTHREAEVAQEETDRSGLSVSAERETDIRQLHVVARE
jgi:hypothetical protein